MRSPAGIFVPALLGTLLLVSAPPSRSRNDVPVLSSAKKISIPGVHNVGKTNDHLYRGAQPGLQELPELKKFGITTVIDLRSEFPQTAEQERIRAEALGMCFHRIPIGGFSNPNDSDLVRFFQILRDSSSQAVFVHCEFGRDRTGVMIAAYRIAFENWSSDQALAEMMQFGFNSAWHLSMIAFVRSLPLRRQSDARPGKAVKPD